MARREREKAEARKAKRDEGPAIARFRDLRMSARKARIVADVIRGLPVEEAATALLESSAYDEAVRTAAGPGPPAQDVR